MFPNHVTVLVRGTQIKPGVRRRIADSSAASWLELLGEPFQFLTRFTGSPH